jgi:hypothetical protein
MINNDDPFLTMIEQPFDLTDPNSPEYDFVDNQISFGISFQKYEVEPNSTLLTY